MITTSFDLPFKLFLNHTFAFIFDINLDVEVEHLTRLDLATKSPKIAWLGPEIQKYVVTDKLKEVFLCQK